MKNNSLLQQSYFKLIDDCYQFCFFVAFSLSVCWCQMLLLTINQVIVLSKIAKGKPWPGGWHQTACPSTLWVQMRKGLWIPLCEESIRLATALILCWNIRAYNAWSMWAKGYYGALFPWPVLLATRISGMSLLSTILPL
jgi:hypothetical protein